MFQCLCDATVLLNFAHQVYLLLQLLLLPLRRSNGEVKSCELARSKLCNLAERRRKMAALRGRRTEEENQPQQRKKNLVDEKNFNNLFR